MKSPRSPTTIRFLALSPASCRRVNFHTGLQFSNGDGGDEYLLARSDANHATTPRAASACAVRKSRWYRADSESLEFRTAEVNRRPAVSTCALRKLHFKPRSTPSNNSLMVGRFDCCSRRHSSIGTRTAASTPRRVTTCGPCFSAAFRNSLKRAFASCSCQEFP